MEKLSVCLSAFCFLLETCKNVNFFCGCIVCFIWY